MSTEAKAVETKAKQRAKSKRATFDKLKNKKLAEREIILHIDGEPMTVLIRAIPMRAYDDLLDKHPPTKDQKALGAAWNTDTFPPAVFAAVSVDPDLSYDEALELWESENFSRGDLAYLWEQSIDVIMTGFNVPFTNRG